MKPLVALFPLILALAAPLASASPVTFGSKVLDGQAPWSASYTLHVDQQSLFSGYLKSVSNKKDNVVIESITLSKGSEQYLFDLMDDEYKFLSVTGDHWVTPGKKIDVTHWGWSYALSPVVLSAGDWDVKVQMNSYSSKFNSSLSGAGTLQAVPEPASLALAVTALGALALVRRRRAAR
ncbi:PEP-CTERM sorting domain-containing protein [Paucibacter sp. PLA-PC-4]|uniref:PEP-CTERM sorting domain-containing protein n=1 Tax=Paucibacter sp. PLA-PC-4 TaxID=2993655 RepID=UPI00224AD7A0|nr:PEP-CTERM sorting domain-containing protein [Paucibacter sp. PLA-PC-4]MCX2863367.1 PEP-CTERM sorting domain-containing protein [Paucibacter sp. PLA-PC-4]